jgi:hypothetical protein
METNVGEFMIIQSGAAQFRIIKFKAQRLDQMQLCTGIGAKPDDVAGVGWNFRLEQNDIEHPSIMLGTPGFV